MPRKLETAGPTYKISLFRPVILFRVLSKGQNFCQTWSPQAPSIIISTNRQAEVRSRNQKACWTREIPKQGNTVTRGI